MRYRYRVEFFFFFFHLQNKLCMLKIIVYKYLNSNYNIFITVCFIPISPISLEWEGQISLSKVLSTPSCLTLCIDRWFSLEWACYPCDKQTAYFFIIQLKRNQNMLRDSNWPGWILGWTRGPFTFPLARNVWKHSMIYKLLHS